MGRKNSNQGAKQCIVQRARISPVNPGDDGNEL